MHPVTWAFVAALFLHSSSLVRSNFPNRGDLKTSSIQTSLCKPIAPTRQSNEPARKAAQSTHFCIFNSTSAVSHSRSRCSQEARACNKLAHDGQLLRAPAAPHLYVPECLLHQPGNYRFESRAILNYGKRLASGSCRPEADIGYAKQLAFQINSSNLYG